MANDADVTPRLRAVSKPVMPRKLAELVALSQDGDREAFDGVVRATYAETYTLAYRLTGDEEDASDVVQDAYLRAFRGIRRFRGESQFSTWMYRITANCAATHLGRRARHRHDELHDDGPYTDGRLEADPEAASDAAALRIRLQDAVAALPPRLRAVVVLRDIYDLTHSDIAAELGISESAAKVRLHRARRKLREQLFVLPGEVSDGDDEDRSCAV